MLAQQLFLALQALREEGLTIVLVEQNVHLALALSEYTYVQTEGRVAIEGESKSVANMEEVRRLLGVQSHEYRRVCLIAGADRFGRGCEHADVRIKA